ncbi:MAG TPA: formate/nitrite transporter family protein [Pseudolabrys sp.]|jgi:formate/nitrite transporter FocA (FNT family)|nr:formate/nitrite transporter family protein [Pseudolabrys sp.]
MASHPASRDQKEKPPSGRNSRSKGISAQEVESVEDMSTPRTPVIYEVVRRLGDEEMKRPATSLWWSGVAAGLSIGFSLLAQAILETHLPDTPWRPLVASFGYCVGFLMVILGRQQLFTESTITVVLPVFKDLTPQNIWRMARLWAIVLVANLAGTLFAALFATYFPVIPPELFNGMLEVSRNGLVGVGWWEMFFRGISSGFLIAAMVWMIPAAESAKFAVITLMTYLIAVGGFTHVVAGSMEAYMLVLAGDWEWWRMLAQFLAPVLLGNMVGGTALFALISYAQVMEEI